MRSNDRIWRNATITLAVALACALTALWSYHGGPAIDSAAHAQFAQRGTLDRSEGADAAIMAALEIVMERYERVQFNWQAEDANDQAAAEVSRVASLIIRNYRPYASPERPERRLRIVPPEEAQQP